MNIRLWHDPYNGGWIWFSRDNLKRFEAGRAGKKYWWAILGFSGSITIQSWPWQKSPNAAVKPRRHRD